jgi:hypothetical protein
MIPNTDDAISKLIDQLEEELPQLVHDVWGQGNIEQITDYVPDSANISLWLTNDETEVRAVELTFDYTYREVADDYRKELDCQIEPLVIKLNDVGELILDRKEIQAIIEENVL